MKVRKRGTIALGYRDSSVPFSFLNAQRTGGLFDRVVQSTRVGD